jgi:hypothetical protein
MDAAYYEDLAGQFYGLLIAVEDRLGVERAQEVHHLIEVGEYELAVEEGAGPAGQGARGHHRSRTRRHACPGPQDEDGQVRRDQERNAR